MAKLRRESCLYSLEGEVELNLDKEVFLVEYGDRINEVYYGKNHKRGGASHRIRVLGLDLSASSRLSNSSYRVQSGV